MVTTGCHPLPSQVHWRLLGLGCHSLQGAMCMTPRMSATLGQHLFLAKWSLGIYEQEFLASLPPPLTSQCPSCPALSAQED